MEVQHLNAKFFVENPDVIDLADLIPIFHEWIRGQVCEGVLLIDVADYRHVFAGPGVVVVGHEANVSLDDSGHRLGLLYNRKALMNGNNQGRISAVIRSALLACRRLEAEAALEGKLKFNGQELQLIVNDRHLAPNTQESFSSLAQELKPVLDRLYGGAEYTLLRNPDPRERLNVHVKTSAAWDVEALLKNLSA